MKFGPCILPDVDTDLQQLSIPATVSCFKPLTSLDLPAMSIVHLLPTYTHDPFQQLSLKLSVAKPESSYDELDCCWKIRDPNHRQKIVNEEPRILFLMQVYRNNSRACSMHHAALSQLEIPYIAKCLPSIFANFTNGAHLRMLLSRTFMFAHTQVY